IRPGIAEQQIDQDARSRALVAVDHQAGWVGKRRTHRALRIEAFETIVAGAVDDPLHAPPAGHEFQPLSKKRLVVASGLLVQEVYRRQVAFAAPGRGKPAKAAHGKHTGGISLAGKWRHHAIKTGAMAADDDEIR